ncbi:MAG TPA: hypothetical protein VF342_01700 [Alphaproteobacteria bacterium]
MNMGRNAMAMATLAALSLAACDTARSAWDATGGRLVGESGSGAAEGPARAGDVTGTYVLERIDGQPVPVTTAAWGNCREDVLGASLALYPDSRYVVSTIARQTCGGRSVDMAGEIERGIYRVDGDRIRLDNVQPDRGTGVPAGWVATVPQRTVDIGDLEGMALLSGDVLTVTPAGREAAVEFRRQPAASERMGR